MQNIFFLRDLTRTPEKCGHAVGPPLPREPVRAHRVAKHMSVKGAPLSIYHPKPNAMFEMPQAKLLMLSSRVGPKIGIKYVVMGVNAKTSDGWVCAWFG